MTDVVFSPYVHSKLTPLGKTDRYQDRECGQRQRRYQPPMHPPWSWRIAAPMTRLACGAPIGDDWYDRLTSPELPEGGCA